MNVSQLYLKSLLADDKSAYPNLLVNAISEGLTQISSEWVDFVNSCLRNKSKKRVGLALLEVTVNNCSSELFAAHAVNWFQHLLYYLQASRDLSTFYIASHLISFIVQFVPQHPDVARELAGQHLQSLVTTLLSAPIQHFVSAVACICSCLRSMPGPMGPFKHRIEKWLLEKGCNNDEQIWQTAAECLALLPRVGGGGQDGVKHAEAWSHLCQQLMSTLRCVLKAILDGTQHDIQSCSEEQGNTQLVGFGIEDLPPTEPDRMSTLVHRHKFLSHCLHHILVTEFPVIVSVPVPSLISLILQTLSVDPRMLASGAQHAERVPLIAATSFIQQSAYELLEGLISSCKQLLLPYCSSVDMLFVQTLNWTKGDRVNPKFPHSSLRIKAYRVYELWLAAGGNCANTEIVDQIVSHTLADAAANKLEDSRDSSNTTDALPPPRKKRKGKQSHDQLPLASFGQRKYLFVSNKSLCQAALKALCRLVVVRGPQLSAKSLQLVLEFVIPLLLDCQQSLLGQSPQLAKSSTWSGLAPDPYASAQCRLLLYRLLRCCVLSSNHLVAAPVQEALAVFSRGIHDTSLEVSLLCRESLAVCDLVIHPRLPSLQRTPAPVHTITTDTIVDINSRHSQAASSPVSTALPENPSVPSLTTGCATTQLTDEIELYHSAASQQSGLETDAVSGDDGIVDQTRSQSEDLSSDVRMGACQSSSGNVTAVEQTTQSVDDAVDVNSHVSVKVSQTNINDYRDISQLDVCQSKSEASIGVNQNENEMIDVGERRRGDAGIDEMLATFVEAPPDSD
ncbi:proline-, glutamic acid- and leucine-rich protein 1-like [Corticium candelabrum]|uniref:proline-, glutamic acid- and leucine-rich protein 1-like n=1 Tax=Corticium candelabrum TaxID=121492 RepID=UPI002E25C47A|nr:proline-, glutamic acid- and leucine-rich protein 1-like [Corticium candelabrum]